MRKKTITALLLSFSLLLNPILADEAANPTAKLLREALFAEQADRDLATAEKGYREIIKEFETDRTYAATAILRLAEILHQRGDTGEAEKWFARVLQEFPDQEVIAKVAAARLGDKATDLLGERPIRTNPQTEEIARIAKLLEQSPDLLNTPKDGTTPLTTAAAKGQLEVVEFLLTKGAQVNVAGSSSALAAAVENGHLAVVARLLNAEAKVEEGLLHIAVRSGNYAVTELLLEAGANPNTTGMIRLSPQEIQDSSSFPSSTTPANEPDDPFVDFRFVDRKPEGVTDAHPEVQWTPLEIATFYRFKKLTDLLLANGAKSQKENGQYSEDLQFAIIDQNSKLVAKLLTNGADPDSHWQQRHGSLNALSIASTLGNTGIVKEFIEAGADVNIAGPNDGSTPLFYAEGPTVALLLAAGADPNVKNKYGYTPLFGVRDPAKAKALLDAGADIKAINKDGLSPIPGANLEVLDVLLAAKPDLTKLEGQHTGLGLASIENSNDLSVKRIEKLIAAGADPNQVDKSSMTPLLLAVSNHSSDIVKALIAGGANPNGVPHNPAPLSILKPGYPNFEAIIRALIDAGADPNAVDLDNENILFKAAQRGRLEIVRYLLKKGAALQVADKFAFQEAIGESKAELFLATYQQPERRRGIIRIVTPELGHIHDEVSAFVSDDEELPECPHTLLEAYAFSSEDNLSFGEVTIWREGKIEPLKIDLRKIIASGDPAQDFELAWGDLIQFSMAKSREEMSVNETEKKFLEDHLNRQVQFTLEGEANQVHLTLRCVQLPNSDLWMIEKVRTQSNYLEGLKNFPLVSAKDLNFVQQSNINSDLYLLEIQSVERDGRKTDISGIGKSTFWLESDDIIFLEKRAQRLAPRPGNTK